MVFLCFPHFSQGLDYQNFRAGNASGARGEVAALGAPSKAAVPYRASQRKAQRPRLVPLIGAMAVAGRGGIFLGGILDGFSPPAR